MILLSYLTPALSLSFSSHPSLIRVPFMLSEAPYLFATPSPP